MLNFFIGFAFFEAGAFFGFFVAALMQRRPMLAGNRDLNARRRIIARNENTLSVLKIAPGQYPQQVEIDNDLKALQQAVGGSIGACLPLCRPGGHHLQ